MLMAGVKEDEGRTPIGTEALGYTPNPLYDDPLCMFKPMWMSANGAEQESHVSGIFCLHSPSMRLLTTRKIRRDSESGVRARQALSQSATDLS